MDRDEVVSILGECALSLETLRNAAEKEKADLMVCNEQLRSNLLRSVSHDIRMPLTTISGNASNLLSHCGQLDEGTRKQIFSDIYAAAEWLIDLAENLLSISCIENGQMALHLSSEVPGDMSEKPLQHVDRNAVRHHIAVKDTDDILLADMDARLILQVLVNIPIIVISARIDDGDKIEALDAGADDYLIRPFSAEELLAWLRVTLRRLEYRILCLLARHTGKVLTHTYITQNLYGRNWDSDIASLRVFMTTLRKKIEPDPAAPKYIQTHIGIGYRMLKVD